MLNTIDKKGKKSKVDLVDEEKRALRLRSFLRAKKKSKVLVTSKIILSLFKGLGQPFVSL